MKNKKIIVTIVMFIFSIGVIRHYALNGDSSVQSALKTYDWIGTENKKALDYSGKGVTVWLTDLDADGERDILLVNSGTVEIEAFEWLRIEQGELISKGGGYGFPLFGKNSLGEYSVYRKKENEHIIILETTDCTGGYMRNVWTEFNLENRSCIPVFAAAEPYMDLGGANIKSFYAFSDEMKDAGKDFSFLEYQFHTEERYQQYCIDEDTFRDAFKKYLEQFSCEKETMFYKSITYELQFNNEEIPFSNKQIGDTVMNAMRKNIEKMVELPEIPGHGQMYEIYREQTRTSCCPVWYAAGKRENISGRLPVGIER